MKKLAHGGQINHSVSYLAPMLPIDVTFDTREETERGQTLKKPGIVKNNNCSKVRYNRGTADKSRDNT